MQQYLFFDKLLKLVTLAFLFSLSACLADKSATGDNVSGSHAVDVRGYSGSYKERFTD